MASEQPNLATPSIEPPASVSVGFSRRRIFKNFVGLSAANLFARIVSMVLGVLVRRALGPEVMGQLAWNGALLGYLSLVGNPGMMTVARRDAARDPNRIVSLASLILSVQFAASFVVLTLACVLALSEFRGEQASQLLILQAALSILLVLNFAWVFESQERMVKPALVGVVMTLLSAPATLWFVRSPNDVWLYLLIPAAFSLLGHLIVMGMLHHDKLLRLSQIRFTFEGFSVLMRESWPFTVSGAAVMLYYNSDALILGMFYPDQMVGLYSTAYQFMLIPSTLAWMLANAYMPMLAKAVPGTDQCDRVAAAYLRQTILILVPMGTLGFIAGGPIFGWVYGTQFAEAGWMYEWLSLNLIGIALAGGVGGPLLLWGKERLHLKVVLTCATVNVGLNLIFIPRFGPSAAIVSTLLSEWLATGLSFLARRDIAPVQWRIPALMTASFLIVAICAKLAMWFFSMGVVPTLLIGVGLPGLLALVWGYWLHRAHFQKIARRLFPR